MSFSEVTYRGCKPSFFISEGHDKDVRANPDKYHKAAIDYQVDGYWVKATMTYLKLAENDLITDAEQLNLALSVNVLFWAAYGYGDPGYAKILANNFNFSKLSAIISSLPYMDFDPPEFREKVKPHLEKIAKVPTSIYNKLIEDCLSWLESKANLEWLESAHKEKTLESFKLKSDDNSSFIWEPKANNNNNNNNNNIDDENYNFDKNAILEWLESKIDVNGNFARMPQQIKTFVLLELLGIITNLCLATVDISDPDWGPPALNVNDKREALIKMLERVNNIWKEKGIDMNINIDNALENIHDVNLENVNDDFQQNVNDDGQKNTTSSNSSSCILI